MIGKAKLTQEELLTVLTEVEAVMNNRPLSYAENFETEEPLTPSHLLFGRRIRSMPEYMCYTEEEYQLDNNKDVLDKWMKLLERILTMHWRRRREYFAGLRECHGMTTNNILANEV